MTGGSDVRLVRCPRYHSSIISLEGQTQGEEDPDIKKNFLEHKIKSLLMEKWELECTAAFKHVFRLDILDNLSITIANK